MRTKAARSGRVCGLLLLASVPLCAPAADRQPAALPDQTLECWFWGKAYDPASGRHTERLLRSHMESLTLRPDGIYETGVAVRGRYDFEPHTRRLRLHGKLYGGIIGYLAPDARGLPTIAFHHAENATAPEAQNRDIHAIDPADTICATERP